MKHIKEIDNIRDDLIEYIEKTSKQMNESAVVFSVFTDNYKESVDSLLQFAVGVMLDKPFYLLVQEGTKIPPKLRQIADGIVFYKANHSDALEKSRELLNIAQKKGHIHGDKDAF